MFHRMRKQNVQKEIIGNSVYVKENEKFRWFQSLNTHLGVLKQIYLLMLENQYISGGLRFVSSKLK